MQKRELHQGRLSFCIGTVILRGAKQGDEIRLVKGVKAGGLLVGNETFKRFPSFSANFTVAPSPRELRLAEGALNKVSPLMVSLSISFRPKKTSSSFMTITEPSLFYNNRSILHNCQYNYNKDLDFRSKILRNSRASGFAFHLFTF